MFYYTNKYYGDGLLESYEKALYAVEGVELIDKYGLSEDEKREWKIDFFDRFDEAQVIASLSSELNEKDLAKLTYNRTIFGVKNES
jgi:hypothetical protein